MSGYGVCKDECRVKEGYWVMGIYEMISYGMKRKKSVLFPSKWEELQSDMLNWAEHYNEKEEELKE